MELSRFENGIAIHHAIRQVIKNDGLYGMHEQGYSYTVGMRNIGTPELVIYGQRPGVLTEIVKIIYSAAAHTSSEIDMNRMLKKIFTPHQGS